MRKPNNTKLTAREAAQVIIQEIPGMTIMERAALRNAVACSDTIEISENSVILSGFSFDFMRLVLEEVPTARYLMSRTCVIIRADGWVLRRRAAQAGFTYSFSSRSGYAWSTFDEKVEEIRKDHERRMAEIEAERVRRLAARREEARTVRGVLVAAAVVGTVIGAIIRAGR